MVSIIRRGLFWRVYLTLLGSLMLVSILGAMLWHRVAEQPPPMAVGVSGAAIGALLPSPGAPKAEFDAALVRISAETGGQVALVGAGGEVVDMAQAGRSLTPPFKLRTGWGGRRGSAMMRTWRARLPDGRSLWVEIPDRLRAGGPHMLVMLLMVAGAVGLAAYPIVSRLTGRLERLRSSLEVWGGGRLDSRAEVEGGDEIAAVAASFNTAADRVEALLAAHKALLAHASHELRSPLTRLRVAVEMFVAQPDPALKPAIVHDIAELDGLVEEILLASRLDHAAFRLERELVDCLSLAAEEAARAGAGVRQAGSETAGAFEIQGSPRLIRRLIRNLVENAVKHGQPPVEIELERSAAAARADILIKVRDQGPGLAEAERERVFEPFYRPAGRPEAAGSWGLGLSIVRQIAELHGGRVAYEPGIGFVATLPVRRGE
jgi:signal transduction histidine kinase